jgi:photosystem II stability/assembly factor-like uncharacterized protein
MVLSGRMTTQGSIYTSSDSGATWTQQTNLSNKWYQWIYTPKGGNGQRIITPGNIGLGPDNLYVSNDYAVTWTIIGTKGAQYFQQPIISQNGNIIYTGVLNDYAYRSTNGGATWTQQGIARGRTSLDGSSDLRYMIQGVDARDVLYSSDYGATWTNFNSTLGWGDWYAVSISEDGQKLMACKNNVAVYTSTNAGATWTTWTLNQYANGYYNSYLTANGSHGCVPLFTQTPWIYTA